MSSLSPKARALVDAVRSAEDPSDGDRDRVRARLASRIALGVAAGAAALTTAESVAASSTGGAASAAATGVAATKATFVASALSISLPLKLLAVGAIASAVAMGATVAAVHRPPVLPAASTVLEPSTPTSQAKALPLAPGRSRAMISTEPPPLAASAAGPSLAPPRAESPARAGAAPQPPSSNEPAPDSLDAELRLIGEARAALTGDDPSRALADCEQYARRFPSGALGEDAAAIHIFALCALGRTSDARAEGVSFLVAHPRSPHVASLEHSCAGERKSNP